MKKRVNCQKEYKKFLEFILRENKYEQEKDRLPGIQCLVQQMPKPIPYKVNLKVY